MKPCFPGTRIIYDRKFLLDRRNSPMAQTPPCHLPNIPGVTSPGTLIEDSKVEVNNLNNLNNHDRKHAVGDDAQFEMDIWLSYEDQKKSSNTDSCVYMIWRMGSTMQRWKRQYQQSPLQSPPPPGAKGCEDKPHPAISYPCFLFPFSLRQLDWRPLSYFCRTKQPTEENG